MWYPLRRKPEFELLSKEEQREVLLLVGLEQMTYEESAGVLGIPVGTVMSRLSRAREEIERELHEKSVQETEARAKRKAARDRNTCRNDLKNIQSCGGMGLGKCGAVNKGRRKIE